MFKTKEGESIRCGNYHGINREYSCICEAKGFHELQSFADEHGISYMQMVRGEWEKLYKTYLASGECWLIQNPALMTLQSAAGKSKLIRKPPVLLKTAAALKKQLDDCGKPEQQERRAFPKPMTLEATEHDPERT